MIYSMTIVFDAEVDSFYFDFIKNKEDAIDWAKEYLWGIEGMSKNDIKIYDVHEGR